jgi:hypothetical protein
LCFAGSATCPVSMYKEYARRRPPAACESTSRFYLQPLKKPAGYVWYSCQPLGKNSIGNLAKRMSAEAGLEKKTNHSGRKTAIQTLLHAEVPPTNVMQLTGHKNIQSLNSYSSVSLKQQEAMSKTLSSWVPILPKPKPNTQETTQHSEAEPSLNDEIDSDVDYEEILAAYDVSVSLPEDTKSTLMPSNNVLNPAMPREVTCSLDDTSGNMSIDIGKFVTSQFNSSTSSKPSSFSFLNDAIYGNVTININSSSA